MSNCRFSKWKGVGHAPQLERPDAFNYLLKKFILSTVEPIEPIEFDEPEDLLTQEPESKFNTVKQWFKQVISKYK
jgi:hypothetical protein